MPTPFVQRVETCTSKMQISVFPCNLSSPWWPEKISDQDWQTTSQRAHYVGDEIPHRCNLRTISFPSWSATMYISGGCMRDKASEEGSDAYLIPCPHLSDSQQSTLSPSLREPALLDSHTPRMLIYIRHLQWYQLQYATSRRRKTYIWSFAL